MNNRELRIEIDFHKQKMTMNAVMEYVYREKAAHPDREYYMDGDTYAIVSKPRKVTA